MRKVAFAAALLIAAAIPVLGGKTASAETSKPSNKSRVVVIQKGDYLSKIAKKYNTTYHRIYYANKQIKHPDLIYPDKKIRIPESNEKLVKRPFPTDAQVPSETKADKRQNRNNYKPKASTNRSTNTSRSTWQPTAAPVQSTGGGVWDRLAACESGGNWSINTGNGYYGGVQFSLSTWHSVGGSGYPHQASKAEQIKRAQILQARSGWGQWPACTAKLGLR